MLRPSAALLQMITKVKYCLPVWTIPKLCIMYVTLSCKHSSILSILLLSNDTQRGLIWEVQTSIKFLISRYIYLWLLFKLKQVAWSCFWICCNVFPITFTCYLKLQRWVLVITNLRLLMFNLGQTFSPSIFLVHCETECWSWMTFLTSLCIELELAYFAGRVAEGDKYSQFFFVVSITSPLCVCSLSFFSYSVLLYVAPLFMTIICFFTKGLPVFTHCMWGLLIFSRLLKYQICLFIYCTSYFIWQYGMMFWRAERKK